MRTFSVNRACLPMLGLALLATTGACKSDDGPDAFVKASIKAVDGEPQAIWKALPESYQKDVQGLVSAFAEKMNAQVYDDGFRLAGKLVKVLETKKDFVLGHPQVQGVVKAEDVSKGWDPAVRSLATLMASDIGTVEGLKKLDVEKFLAGPIAAVMEDLLKAAEVAAAQMPSKGAPNLADMRTQLRASKVTVEKVEGDQATVRIEIPGEKPEVEEMVKVEGKWIPKKLADAWPAAMVQAKAAVAGMKIEPAMVVQFNGLKGVVDPVLDGLLAAKTQEEFNGHIDSVMKAFMPNMGSPAMARASDEPSLDANAEQAEQPKKAAKRNKKKKQRR